MQVQMAGTLGIVPGKIVKSKKDKKHVHKSDRIQNEVRALATDLPSLEKCHKTRFQEDKSKRENQEVLLNPESQEEEPLNIDETENGLETKIKILRYRRSYGDG